MVNKIENLTSMNRRSMWNDILKTNDTKWSKKESKKSLDHSRMILPMTILTLCTATIVSNFAYGATSGESFQGAYDFIYGAATGYLGRSIAIAGGLVGLGAGAATGRPLPAVVGILLGIFGVQGPAIINSIFASALI